MWKLGLFGEWRGNGRPGVLSIQRCAEVEQIEPRGKKAGSRKSETRPPTGLGRSPQVDPPQAHSIDREAGAFSPGRRWTRRDERGGPG